MIDELLNIELYRRDYKFHNPIFPEEVDAGEEFDGEVQDDPMKIYTNQIKDLDEKREGLEFEITDLLAEMDTQASYDGVDPET